MQAIFQKFRKIGGPTQLPDSRSTRHNGADLHHFCNPGSAVLLPKSSVLRSKSAVLRPGSPAKSTVWLKTVPPQQLKVWHTSVPWCYRSVAQVCTRRSRGNRRKIGKWPEIPGHPLEPSTRSAPESAPTSEFRTLSLQFTDMVLSAPFFLVRLPGGRPRLRLSDGGAAVTAAGKAVAVGATASGSSLRPKSWTSRTATSRARRRPPSTTPSAPRARCRPAVRRPPARAHRPDRRGAGARSPR